MSDKDEFENFKDFILEKEKQGKIVFVTWEGLAEADLDEIIKQPTEGLLYDLNRDKATILTWIEDKKWVNDFACAKVIEKLKTERDAQQERIAELEKQMQKTRDNFYAADRLNIETQKTTTVQFSAMISRYVDQCGDQQERIADLERQIEIGDEALTMLQENHDGDMAKLKEKQKTLHRRCQKAEGAVAKHAKKHGPSMGRALTNAEAARLKEENGFLKARLERYEGEDHNAGGDDG